MIFFCFSANLCYFYFFFQCRSNILFENDHCRCTVGQVGDALHPYGFLCSFTVSVGTFVLGQKFKNSDKLVAPYVCAVCELPSSFFF